MTTTEAPQRRYRIAEIGRLTGFSPTTLRFYENAGVLAPAERTPSGYRVYGDRDVERLRLIARAKELGCTLEEIAGLVEAWEADECGPVKHRLRGLVTTKLADIQRHIAEQVAFAAQLRETAVNLAGLPVSGPCDDTCGCATPSAGGASSGDPAGGGRGCGPSTASAPVALLTGGADGSGPPVACSLSAADVERRVQDWQAVLAGVVRREALTGGVRLVFDHGAPLAEISRLAAAEYDCCPFFAFSISIDGRGITVDVTAPADGQVLLGSVFGVAA